MTLFNVKSIYVCCWYIFFLFLVKILDCGLWILDSGSWIPDPTFQKITIRIRGPNKPQKRPKKITIHNSDPDPQHWGVWGRIEMHIFIPVCFTICIKRLGLIGNLSLVFLLDWMVAVRMEGEEKQKMFTGDKKLYEVYDEKRYDR